MEGFELSCSKMDGHSILKFFGEIPVQTILLSEGQVRIMKHISTMSYNPLSKEIDQDIWGTNLFNTPFLYSGKSNMFTVIGVNTLAYMTDNVVSKLCAQQEFIYDYIWLAACFNSSVLWSGYFLGC